MSEAQRLSVSSPSDTKTSSEFQKIFKTEGHWEKFYNYAPSRWVKSKDFTSHIFGFQLKQKSNIIWKVNLQLLVCAVSMLVKKLGIIYHISLGSLCDGN